MVGLENVDESVLHINPNEVLADIKKGRGDWENKVPESIVDMIIKK